MIALLVLSFIAGARYGRRAIDRFDRAVKMEVRK
jgi:hypothetical protein